MDKQIGPNLFTVIVLGLPGAVLLGFGFFLGANYEGLRFGVGMAMLLFGLLLFIGAVIMLIGWAIRTFKTLKN
jgi:hypothetical protein